MSLPMYISENGYTCSYDNKNHRHIYIKGLVLFIIAIFIIYWLSFESRAIDDKLKVDTILLRNNAEQQINHQCENNSNYNSAIMIKHINITDTAILIYIQLNNSY